MFKFVIKNIAGESLYTSVCSYGRADLAQTRGNTFINRRRSINNLDRIVQKGNYIDVISV